MKRLFLYAILATILFCSCGASANLSKSIYLTEGMTKQEVLNIMGTPCSNEFNRGVTEWHYCSTGLEADKFLACYFEGDRLIAIKQYTVTTVDVGGASGHCSKFIKRGTYREPDVVIAIRARYGD